MTESNQNDAERPPTGAADWAGDLRTWSRKVAGWRNWRLPVKVAAVLAVPAIAAVTLGAIQIHGDIANADSYAHVQNLVALRDSLTPLATDLQSERLLAAQKLGTTTQIDIPAYYQLNSKIDKEAQNVASVGKQLLDPTTAAGIRYQGLIGQLAGLGSLHQQALSNGADVTEVTANYSVLLNSVLDLEEALSTQLGNPALTGAATGLTDIEVAQEQIRQQQAIVTVGIARGELLDTELTTMRSSEGLLSDRLEDFQVVAAPAELALYQQAATVNAINNREQLAQAVLSNGQTLEEVGTTGLNGASLGVTPAVWTAASNNAAHQLVAVEQRLAGELRDTSAALRDQATNAAGVEAVVLFVVVLLALAIGVVIGRNLLRSLGVLRRTALEVAEYRLPEVVANIEAGDLSGQRIEPVPLDTDEELGQLARAFDAVHGQAVRSAIGQANLRGNLRNIFINLSRRSQSLVERQLRLMEKLERNEEDPQQLANLFRLDHLATRMRRNNENLMVLSGDDPARRSGHPLPLADVLRAAVSEIEHYQRVVVRSTPPVDVLGYASGDLVRLIAELLDNATSFSPPATQVRIGGQGMPDGSVRIEIHDEGIGMAEAELAEANAKLNADSADVPVSRQMGLYVVGRLARRHSISVALRVVPDGGLLAVVEVPADLVKPSSGPVRPATTALPPTANGRANGALNGHTNGHANGMLDGITTTNGGTKPRTNGSSNGSSNGVTQTGRNRRPATNGHTTSGLLPDAPSIPGRRPVPAPTDAETTTTSANLEPTGFTWFTTKGARNGQSAATQTGGQSKPAQETQASQQNQPAQVSQPPEPVSFTAVGLPRRVPRSHAVPSLVQPANGRHQAPPGRPYADVSRTDPGHTAAHRSPTRRRGFLDDYQAGIRQGQTEPSAGDDPQREGDTP